MNPWNLKKTISTSHLYFMKFADRMFWNIYSESLDSMALILPLLENKLKKEVGDNLSGYVFNLQLI